MLRVKPSLKDQHILIVDDNNSNLLIIDLLLQEEKVTHTYKALSAKKAYEILEREPISAILLDVMMPDIDGIQACKTIRSNENYDMIPIIMVTANDDNKTFKESFNAGADDFIPKPVNSVILISRLQSQLEKYEMRKTLIEQSRFSAMDEMISMLAHQWRQPLGIMNAIANNIRIKIQLNSAKNEDIEIAFDKIEDNLDELSKMITTFKTSFGSHQTQEWTNLASTIDELLKLRESDIKKLNIEVTKEIGDILPHALIRQAFVQVFIHLIKNSFEAFIRNNIAHPKIIIRLQQKQNFAHLTIIDNAGGISENNLSHIFEPYFSTKEEKNGKGLGLYFAKQLVEKQLEGSLKIDSKEEQTTALVTISLENLC